jgi:hypothetical protein
LGTHKCAEIGHLPLQRALNRLTEITDEVKAIGDLGRHGRAFRGSTTIVWRAITGNHDNLRMALEPRADGRGGAISEEIDGTVAL